MDAREQELADSLVVKGWSRANPEDHGRDDLMLTPLLTMEGRYTYSLHDALEIQRYAEAWSAMRVRTMLGDDGGYTP